MVVELLNKIKEIIPKPVKKVILFSGNIMIIWVFLRALINPENYAEWIYKNAILIFLIEFLSIHSSGMSVGISKDEHKSAQMLFLIIFYLIFAVAFGVAFQNWFIPFYFVVSTYIKMEEASNFSDKQNIAPFIGAGIFLAVTFLIASISPVLKTLFPFSSAVLKSRPVGAGGLFIDVPQTTLVWGIVYFSLYLVINVVMLFRRQGEGGEGKEIVS